MINKRNIRNSSRRDFRRKFRNRENLIFHVKLVRWKTKKRNGCEDTGKFVLEESQWSISDNGGTYNVYTCAGRAKAGVKPKEESQWMCGMNRSYAISRPIRRSSIWITEPQVIDTLRGLTGEFVASAHLTVYGATGTPLPPCFSSLPRRESRTRADADHLPKVFIPVDSKTRCYDGHWE